MYKILTKSDELPAFFPLTMTFSNYMPDTGEHSHDCVEIGIVLRGKAAHLYNGNTRFLYPGDVIILAPEQRHSFPEVENFSMCNVLFHPRELNIPQQDLVKFPVFRIFSIPILMIMRSAVTFSILGMKISVIYVCYCHS